MAPVGRRTRRLVRIDLSVCFPVYVVDDDASLRSWAELLLEELELEGRTFPDGEAFLSAHDELSPGCVLLDMRMPQPNGLSVQAELGARGSCMPVIAMTGYGDVDVAVQSMRLGAIEFPEKPFSAEVLKAALEEGFRQLSAEAS